MVNLNVCRGWLAEKGGVAYGEREMRVVLEEDRHGLPNVPQFQGADVLPSKKDFALVRIVQPHCELENGAFSGAVGPYDDLQNVRSA